MVNNVVCFDHETISLLVSTAQSVMLIGAQRDILDISKDTSYAMLYMSQRDRADLRLSMFAYDRTKTRAVHVSAKIRGVSPDRTLSGAELNVLPRNKTVNDRRAFLSIDDILNIQKWLKTCPKSCLVNMSFDEESTASLIALSCIHTGKSNKVVQDLTTAHDDRENWICNFRHPFNHARSAYINVDNNSALHTFTSISVPASDAKLIGELFTVAVVSMTPFDSGSKCYVRREGAGPDIELVFCIASTSNVKGDMS